MAYVCDFVNVFVDLRFLEDLLLVGFSSEDVVEARLFVVAMAFVVGAESERKAYTMRFLLSSA